MLWSDQQFAFTGPWFGKSVSLIKQTVVAMELAKYNIGIALLSETCFYASGSQIDLEYTFYLNKPNVKRREVE